MTDKIIDIILSNYRSGFKAIFEDTWVMSSVYFEEFGI